MISGAGIAGPSWHSAGGDFVERAVLTDNLTEENQASAGNSHRDELLGNVSPDVDPDDALALLTGLIDGLSLHKLSTPAACPMVVPPSRWRFCWPCFVRQRSRSALLAGDVGFAAARSPVGCDFIECGRRR